MNITYEITEETYSPETNTRMSYGIAAYTGDHENGTVKIAAEIHNITTDKQALTELVSLCNRLELSATHLHDVIDDFLAR